ncbi:OLC1v1037577C1 [Oldenlandia corymbosa var. corymbosa]|uniref:OLC1v1037577C1 n=1 Tax=Oldenlandia corymbosa var. corymbosa TaxID=529605 RepID=A0AAV1CXN9_OLDCO|nr:OLC1v1037577C1 [Oldenlandia corymbosa var. corymbosa]
MSKQPTGQRLSEGPHYFPAPELRELLIGNAKFRRKQCENLKEGLVFESFWYRKYLSLTDNSGRRGYLHIHDNEDIPLIYLVSQNWPELYVCFAPIGGVDHASSSGQATGAVKIKTEDERGEEEGREQAGSDDEHVLSSESYDEEDGNDTKWMGQSSEHDTYAEKRE